MATLKEDIADKLVSIVSGVSGITTVNFDRVRLASDDFREDEIPVVQFWDVGQQNQHEQGRIRITWNIALELIMKSLLSGTVDQKALWAKVRDIELALWDKPNLEIPGVIHLIYTGNITDLHLLEPYYIARLDFQVLYYDSLTGTC